MFGVIVDFGGGAWGMTAFHDGVISISLDCESERIYGNTSILLPVCAYRTRERLTWPISRILDWASSLFAATNNPLTCLEMMYRVSR
jgi:hypothetical protein